MDKNTLEQILTLVAKAPSGDNSQPWSFTYNNETLGVFALADADHPILNVHRAGTYIALGALLHNLVHATKIHQFEATVIEFPDHNNPLHVANVTFSKNHNVTNVINEAVIESRHTNRKVYRAEPLGDALLQNLKPQSATETDTVFITDRTAVEQCGRIAATMEQIALSTQELHKIFFNSIFWSKTANQKGKSGLYIETMELPPPVKLLFKLLRYWSVMRVLGVFGFPKLVSSTNAEVYASCGAIGLIYTENNDSPQEYLNVGKSFQETWLHTTKQGLSLQPIAGILYLLRYIDLHPNETILSDKNKVLLADVKQELLNLNSHDSLPAMMFRIGYADKPTSTSQRRAVVVH